MGPLGKFAAVAALTITSSAFGQDGLIDFSYRAPGKLYSTAAGNGRVSDRKVYLPEIIFPIKQDADFPNSQVYGVGGEFGSPGSLCSPENYKMPWIDTYCEKRSWAMPLCPTGVGHQGNDIRGPTCDDDKWEVVAVEDGTIVRVSDYPIVYLKGRNSGTLYRYMHVNPNSIQVKPQQKVKAGTVLAHISDWMNGKPHQTSRHLHFDARQNVSIGGSVQPVYVPPYTSLIVAYRKAHSLPSFEQNGELLVDPQREK